MEGSVEDQKQSLTPLLDGCDMLVHAAALVLADVPWPRLQAVNVQGTRQLFEVAISKGITRAVHISSVAVYGGLGGPIDEGSQEDFPLHPREQYARSKRASERVVRDVTEGTGMAAAVLRPSAIYGERDRLLVPKLLHSLSLPVHPLIGGGHTPTALVYAGNLAHAVLAGLRRPLSPGAHIYNVADDHPITLRYLLSALAAHLDMSFRPIWVAGRLALSLASLGDVVGLRIPGVGGLPLRRAALLMIRPNPYRSVRIREELGWRPVVSLDEGLERTARWIQNTRSTDNLVASKD